MSTITSSDPTLVTGSLTPQLSFGMVGWMH